MKLGVQPDRVLLPMLNDRMVAKGLILQYATAFFSDFLHSESIDDLVALLRKVPPASGFQGFYKFLFLPCCPAIPSMTSSRSCARCRPLRPVSRLPPCHAENPVGDPHRAAAQSMLLARDSYPCCCPCYYVGKAVDAALVGSMLFNC